MGGGILLCAQGIADTELVEIGALVHDVDDFKYSGSEIAGIDNVARFLAEKVGPSACAGIPALPHAPLGHRAQKYPQEKADKVVRIVEGVSFRKEIGVRGGPGETCLAAIPA